MLGQRRVMNEYYTPQFNEEVKTIVTCEECLQKIRIPRRKRKICVTCPKCGYEFPYQYYGLSLSSAHKKPLLVGLIGSLAGFLIIEFTVNSQFFTKASPIVYAMAIFGIFGICIGTALETAEGFFKHHQPSIRHGFRVGATMGLVIGMISGLFAQLVFSGVLLYASLNPYTLLWSAIPNLDSSFISMMLARTVGWCALGFLIGLSYDIKEKSFGYVKSGLVGGLIGGVIGGFLFDPLTSAFQIGEGTFGRLFGFAVLGMAIVLAIFRFRVNVHHVKPKAEKVEAVVNMYDSMAGPIIIFSGILVFIAGMFLVAGNMGGFYPTFPFAGFLTTGLGSMMITAGLKL